MGTVPAPRYLWPSPRRNSTSSQLYVEMEQGHGERLELVRGSCFASSGTKMFPFKTSGSHGPSNESSFLGGGGASRDPEPWAG